MKEGVVRRGKEREGEEGETDTFETRILRAREKKWGGNEVQRINRPTSHFFKREI